MSGDPSFNDYKNVIIAGVMSLLIVFGWEMFFVKPNQVKNSGASIYSSSTSELSKDSGVSVEENAVFSKGKVGDIFQGSVQSEGRVLIDTDTLSGSINLTGGVVDYISLNKHKESIEDNANNVSVLSPKGSRNPYYVFQGWNSDSGNINLPDHETIWELHNGEVLSPGKPVVLRWDNGQGLMFYRTISIDELYMISLSDKVENYGSVPVNIAPYTAVVRGGHQKDREYFILHEGLIGVFDGQLHEVTYDDARDFDFDSSTKSLSKTYGISDYGWSGFTDKYWMTILIPGDLVPLSSSFEYFKYPSGRSAYEASMLYNTVNINSGSISSFSSSVFVGPKEVSTIRSYQDLMGIVRFEDSVDWGWFFFFTKPLFDLLMWIKDQLGNLGFAIVMLTFIVKLCFYPLSYKAFVSMSNMQKFHPEIQNIRNKYADDKMKMQKEMMSLYSKYKINPASGCLPILLQIPVFFSLYKVLFVTIEMRHAPFFGWIQDLAARDPTSIFNIFGLLPYEVPDFLLIGVWPLLMGITMFIQQNVGPQIVDPTQKKIMNILPLVFTIMLAGFPVGLVVYWTVSNMLTILQQMINMKRRGMEVNIIKRLKGIFVKST